MAITAALIMRNEAPLIAAKIAACTAWADQIVIIDQHSEDGSLMIAREVLRLLEVPGTAGLMEGEILGKEFSFAQAFEAAHGDWVVFTDIDEVLVTRRPLSDILEDVPSACAAPRILRWHAVASGERFLKTEPFEDKRFRILRKPGASVFRPRTRHYRDLLHKQEPVEKRAEDPRHTLPRKDAFLMEFKASYQHVADQLFYQAVGSRNDLQDCVESLPESAIRLGRALFEAGHTKHSPGRPPLAWRLGKKFRRNRPD